jgi:hypothetical protein
MIHRSGKFHLQRCPSGQQHYCDDAAKRCFIFLSDQHTRFAIKRGNPRAENLFGVIAQLQQQEGINIELRMRSH